jgi:S-adenosylhomocysteine hydrolase
MILVLHLLPDLVPLLDAFERLGLKPAETVLIGKPYPYAGKSDTVVRLLSRGYKVTLASEHKARFSEESIPPRVVIEALRAVCDGAYIIVEDGGYCAGALLANAGIKRPLGVVEQTAKGARRTETAQNLDFPVVSVAKSQFKADWEAPLIGRTVAENIRALLPEVHTDGGTAMVLGFGSIGQNVCRYLSGYLGMLVRVVDPNPTRVELALSAEFAGVVESAGTELGSLADGVMLVVGTAGSTTVDAAMLDALADETYLVSASSDRNEIAVDVLEDLAGPHGTTVLARGVVEYRISNGSGPKRIRILGDGYPVNFFGASSVPNESIDPIMLLLLLGAVQVATENLGPEVRTDIPDDFVKEYRLRENFRMLHGGGDSGEKDV